MSEAFICPKTNEPCPQEALCSVANEPLINVIPTIKRAVEGAGDKLVGNRLLHHLEVASVRLPKQLHPAVDDNSGYICPADTIATGRVGNIQIEPEIILQGLANIAQACVDQTISDLRGRRWR